MSKKQKKAQSYERIGEYKLNEVLPFITSRNTIKILIDKGLKRKSKEWKKAITKEYDGHIVKMNSTRYFCFKTHGTKCVNCGIIGTRFALERVIHSNTEKYHFNLYAVKKDGSEVMMTKDHIIPKSKGGSNKLDNLQPMCIKCNSKKGNKYGH